jgi:hypothetical protein
MQNNPQVKKQSPSTTPPRPQIEEPQQQNEAFPTHGTIFRITRGSNTNFKTKRQRQDYYREVNHISVEGPITQTKWSHIPIIFSAQDVSLTSFPHTDSMVITAHIDQWDVVKILIDNGSQAEILFLSTFKKMGHNKELKEPMKPLYGFGGKRIEPVSVIKLPVSFGTPKTFDIIDMLYPYNAIFGRGLLNTFEAAMYSAYLSLKVPATFDAITVFGS